MKCCKLKKSTSISWSVEKWKKSTAISLDGPHRFCKTKLCAKMEFAFQTSTTYHLGQVRLASQRSTASFSNLQLIFRSTILPLFSWVDKFIFWDKNGLYLYISLRNFTDDAYFHFPASEWITQFLCCVAVVYTLVRHWKITSATSVGKRWYDFLVR